MLDPAIKAFLNERKDMWLKKKINSKTTDEEKLLLEQEASEQFALASWLPDAAKRAKQLSLVSHPSKFTHSSAKTSSIIAQAERKADGYLRTGNVDVALDVFGNAAAMDVYKFLSTELSDGQTVLQHLEQQTEYIQQQLTTPEHSFSELSSELLMIKDSGGQAKTSTRVKQVYFPINEDKDEYHLLSVLTSSGMMYELKSRLNTIRFSDEAKAAREAHKAEKAHTQTYQSIFDLTAIGFGGTKPQNISVLNSQNGGVANLLSSVPPVLEKNKLSPPKSDFFVALRLKPFKDDFEALHQKLLLDQNDRHIRIQVKGIIKSIIYQVIDHSWRIRYLQAGWSQNERSEKLPRYQKLWLDQMYRDTSERDDDDQWLDEVKTEMARWFSRTYKKFFKTSEIHLTDDELIELKKIISECEEALK